MRRCYGFDSQKNYMNRILRSYGWDYYAERNRDGVLCVFRKAKKMVVAAEWDGFKLLNIIDSPEFVFALTDTWQINGVPREWGADFVLCRLKETDWWANSRFLEEMDAHNEKIRESKRRDFRNRTESWLYENASAFRKAFNDVNTSTLSKREKAKEKRDKRRF